MVTWGDPEYGGDSSQVRVQLVRVQCIQAAASAFAAILQDGYVVTWGHHGHGGDNRQVRERLVRVQQIQATRRAFAAILQDGSVVTWGSPWSGGDSSQVQDLFVRVQQIQATHRAFAAILADGSVLALGDPDNGGDSRQIQSQLDLKEPPCLAVGDVTCAVCFCLTSGSPMDSNISVRLIRSISTSVALACQKACTSTENLHSQAQ